MDALPVGMRVNRPSPSTPGSLLTLTVCEDDGVQDVSARHASPSHKVPRPALQRQLVHLDRDHQTAATAARGRRGERARCHRACPGPECRRARVYRNAASPTRSLSPPEAGPPVRERLLRRDDPQTHQGKCLSWGHFPLGLSRFPMICAIVSCLVFRAACHVLLPSKAPTPAGFAQDGWLGCRREGPSRTTGRPLPSCSSPRRRHALTERA